MAKIHGRTHRVGRVEKKMKARLSALVLLLIGLQSPVAAISLRRRSTSLVAAGGNAPSQAGKGKVVASKWEVATDPASGRNYYWNTETRETTWARPAEMDAVDPVPQQQQQPALTWSGPSRGNAVAGLATRARDSLTDRLTAFDAWRSQLFGAGKSRLPKPDAAGVLTKGLVLGSTLALGVAVL